MTNQNKKDISVDRERPIIVRDVYGTLRQISYDELERVMKTENKAGAQFIKDRIMMLRSELADHLLLEGSIPEIDFVSWKVRLEDQITQYEEEYALLTS